MNTKTSVYLFILFSSVSILYSCQTADKIKRTSFNQILLDEEYGKPEAINLDGEVTFEFIPLETTDKSLIDDRSYNVVHVDADNIVITNYSRCEVFFFSRDGKLKSSFGGKGAGPNEFRVRITGSFWDSKKKELYLNDAPYMNRILVFDEKGKHLRTLPIQEQYRIDRHIMDFDANTFLAYDEKNTGTQEAHVVMHANPYPYILLSKTTGKKVRELPFYIPKRVSTDHHLGISETRSRGASISGTFPFKRYGDEFIICDIGLDSIYSYSPRTGAKVALFSKLPELQNQEFPKTLVLLKDYTDRYVLFRRFVNYYDFETNEWADDMGENIVYDQQKKSFSRVSFTSGMGADWFFVNASKNPVLPKNTLCGVMYTEHLLDGFEKGLIKNPELKRIVSTMKYDDNFVLLLIHFNK